MLVEKYRGALLEDNVKTMNILVSNDDGIDAPGIRELAVQLAKIV